MQIYQPQIKWIKDLFLLGGQLRKMGIEELQNYVEIEHKINRDNLIYETDNTNTIDFQKFLGRDIMNGTITINDALEGQTKKINLILVVLLEQEIKIKKMRKNFSLQRQMFLNAFEMRIFQ